VGHGGGVHSRRASVGRKGDRGGVAAHPPPPPPLRRAHPPAVHRMHHPHGSGMAPRPGSPLQPCTRALGLLFVYIDKGFCW
jgi:hypothetical protein